MIKLASWKDYSLWAERGPEWDRLTATRRDAGGLLSQVMGQNERNGLDLINWLSRREVQMMMMPSVLVWAAHWGWDPELSGQERKEN